MSDERKILLTADYSAIEARIVAYTQEKGETLVWVDEFSSLRDGILMVPDKIPAGANITVDYSHIGPVNRHERRAQCSRRGR